MVGQKLTSIQRTEAPQYGSVRKRTRSRNIEKKHLSLPSYVQPEIRIDSSDFTALASSIIQLQP